MKTRMTFSVRIRSIITAATAGLVLTALFACDNTADGDRCNFALSHNECSNPNTVSCVSPPAAACNGEAYCCMVDSTGAILASDTNPNCQFLISCQAPATTDSGAPEASTESGPDETSTDAGDAGDATDASDAADASDATDASDAAEGSDGSDASDATLDGPG